MITCLLTNDPYLLRELERLQIEIILPSERASLAALQVTSAIVDKIKARRRDDLELAKMIQKAEEGNTLDFTVQEGILKFRNRLCVPKNPELKRELLKELHDSTLSTHPGSTKMYQDLKSHYWLSLIHI